MKSKNWVIAMAILALGTTFTTSCSKSEDTAEIVATQGTKLVINVSGIADEQSSIKQKSSVARTIPTVVSYNEFDATVSVDNQVPASALTRATSNFRNSSLSTINGSKAASIEEGVKYRLFLFKADGSLESSTLLTSGTAGSIAVTPGTNYKWVALSYNNTEDVADVAAGSTAIALPGGKDVLYAKGTVSAPTGNADVPINITFQRKFSRLAIELNTMGMFADMESANVEVKGLSMSTATIDLTDGSLNNYVNHTQTIDFSKFTNKDPLYSDAKIAYIYTASNAQNDVRVEVSNLKIKLDDNSSRQFGATPTRFNFSVTPEMGQSHRLLVNLIESPLTTTASGASTGVETKWARQNLYYVAGHNEYRFHHTNKATSARNTYFSFRGIVPEKFGKNGDPCALVYPEGVWKTADEENFRGLVGSLLLGLGAKSGTTGVENGVGYSEYDATGTAAPYPSNKLRFNYNGQQIVLSVVNDLINVNLGDFGTEGNY